MSAVRQRDTGPELSLRRALYAAGLRGWRCNYRRAPGRPDIAWPRLSFAVFVDGAFWHGHRSRHQPGRSGEYWDKKIAGNVARDRRVDAELRATGWRVTRVWDFEVRREIANVVDRIGRALIDQVWQYGAAADWQRALVAKNASTSEVVTPQGRRGSVPSRTLRRSDLEMP